MAKTLYHGAFVKLGSVTATVTTDVLKSKYPPKDGVPGTYVGLTINGESYSYTIENDACDQFWQGRKGTTVQVQATGSRGDANFTEVGEGQAPPTQPARQTAAPAPANHPPPSNKPSQAAPSNRVAPAAVTPEQAMVDAKNFVARNLTLATIALQATMTKATEFEAVFGFPLPESTFTAVYTSCLYGASAHGIGTGLPKQLALHPVAGNP